MSEFVLTIIMVVVLLLGMRGISAWSCSSSAEQNNVEYRWGMMAGCSYQHPESGIWIPKENYRAIGD